MLSYRKTANADSTLGEELSNVEQAAWSNRPPSESLIAVIVRRRWVMLAMLLSSLVVGLLFLRFSPAQYEATCSIQVAVSNGSSSSSDSDLPLIVNLHSLTRGNTIDTQIDILGSADLLKDAFRQLPAHDRLSGFHNEQPSHREVSIAARPNTNLIEITVNAQNPRAAAAYANRIATTYFARNQDINLQSTRQAREIIGQRLQKARSDYQNSMAALANYQQQTSIVNFDQQYAKSMDNLAALKQDLIHTRAQVSADQRLLSSLRAMLDSTADTIVASTVTGENPQYSLVLQHLEDLTVERARLLQEYQPQSQEVQEITARITEQQARLQQIQAKAITSQTQGRNNVHDDLYKEYAMTSANIDANRVRIQVLSDEISQQEKMVKQLPPQAKRLADLKMATEIVQDNISTLAHQYQSLVLSESTCQPSGRIVAAAVPQSMPASSKLSSILMRFFALGVFIAVLAALMSEMLDQRITDRTMAERVAGIPCIGTIPRLPQQAMPVLNIDDEDDNIIERFLVLHNSLAYADYDHTRLLAVTSSAPGEGKTLCSLYLACAVAEAGKRVLLVDANFRHPALHVTGKEPPTVGLAQVATGGAQLENVIVSSDHAGIKILPTGMVTLNPAKLYAALKTQDLFRKVALAYDAVIIDGPSCSCLSDVQMLSTMVDGVLLVVDEKHTTKRILREAGTILQQSGSGFAGMIMNNSLSQQRL